MWCFIRLNHVWAYQVGSAGVSSLQHAKLNKIWGKESKGDYLSRLQQLDWSLCLVLLDLLKMLQNDQWRLLLSKKIIRCWNTSSGGYNNKCTKVAGSLASWNPNGRINSEFEISFLIFTNHFSNFQIVQKLSVWNSMKMISSLLKQSSSDLPRSWKKAFLYI